MEIAPCAALLADGADFKTWILPFCQKERITQPPHQPGAPNESSGAISYLRYRGAHATRFQHIADSRDRERSR
jgi:hypothetical protein